MCVGVWVGARTYAIRIVSTDEILHLINNSVMNDYVYVCVCDPPTRLPVNACMRANIKVAAATDHAACMTLITMTFTDGFPAEASGVTGGGILSTLQRHTREEGHTSQAPSSHHATPANTRVKRGNSKAERPRRSNSQRCNMRPPENPHACRLTFNRIRYITQSWPDATRSRLS